MKESKLPAYVTDIITRLSDGGFEAHMVGGCVRDMLLSKRPLDRDIATSASPSEVTELFRRVIPVGISHGTVKIMQGGTGVEVTTFRVDGEYLDSRRPESVTFTGSLTEDLRRRDFTINAMAMDLSGNITDPHGGREDLKNRVIRCVGDAEERFGEDALRMFRAFRFAARLGFSVDPEILNAVRKLAHRAASLSAERVRSELQKVLLTKNPELLEPVFSLGLLDSMCAEPSPRPVFLRDIARLPRLAMFRWAGFCAALESQGVITSTSAFLRLLRLDSKTVRACSRGMHLAQQPLPTTAVGWKRLLSENEFETVFCAAAASDAVLRTGNIRSLRSILRHGECFTLGRLAVNGGDLEKLGFAQGSDVGRALRKLLAYVIEHPEENSRERLASLAKEIKAGLF